MAVGTSKPSDIEWPGGKDFALTFFDDCDMSTVATTKPVYDVLIANGLRGTKSVWPLARDDRALPPRDSEEDYTGMLSGDSCADPDYLAWVRELHRQGFEIGFHNARCHSSPRALVGEGLERFLELFGAYPRTMSNHYQNDDCIYWGEARLSGWCRWAYRAASVARHQPARPYYGHVEGSPYFWGDLCRERLDYCRNFVYRDLNTLKLCPTMPYHDPRRPWVRGWYASAEAGSAKTFVAALAESNQERLVAERGACILYTHLGKHMVEHGRMLPEAQRLVESLGRRNGWFCTVAELLDFLRDRQGGIHRLSDRERNRLQWAWLRLKLRHGSS